MKDKYLIKRNFVYKDKYDGIAFNFVGDFHIFNCIERDKNPKGFVFSRFIVDVLLIEERNAWWITATTVNGGTYGIFTGPKEDCLKFLKDEFDVAINAQKPPAANGNIDGRWANVEVEAEVEKKDKKPNPEGLM